ncbi:MAG TPA: methyltransferase domain-containing protein [Candidatus Paceibacterota bacterium]
MEHLLDLDELGCRLAHVDNMIMILSKRRMDLVDQVGRHKRKTGEPIFRPEVEDRRINWARAWASLHGVNEHFAESLMYLLINEACKRQIILIQGQYDGAEPEDEEQLYQLYRKNLLTLTERCAESYDEGYASKYLATQAYLGVESELLLREAENAPRDGNLLDLGCATGRIAFQLYNQFPQTIGYDLSPDMIQVARRRVGEQGLGSRISFCETDLELGIPAASESAALLVMNMGTASDVRDFGQMFAEIIRVLKPGGRFFLSFYNADALLYKWELIPWATGLAASVNTHRHCLEVHSENEILSVHARAYRISEVRNILDAHGIVGNIATYPTVSAILPSELFEGQPELQTSIKAIDRSLMNDSMGAYMIVRGGKK